MEGSMDENNHQLRASSTIADLNATRRQLILETRELKLKQAQAIDKVAEMISKEHEDVAETFFCSTNEANGKYFGQRLDNCLKTMKSEIKRLEESIGAQLGDIEEEVETSLGRLASKEKEFETLKTTFRGPAVDAKEYKDFLGSLLRRASSTIRDVSRTNPDLDALLTWKAGYEEKLEAIIENRTAQLREAVVQLQEEVLQVSMPAKLRYRKIDLTAQALNKAIDAQLQPQHQAADSERERLLKQHFLDQLAIHKSYVAKYNYIKAQNEEQMRRKKLSTSQSHSNPLRKQQQQLIHSAHLSSSHIHSTTTPAKLPASSTEAAVVSDSHSNNYHHQSAKAWRLELVDGFEDQLTDTAGLLAEADELRAQWRIELEDSLAASANQLQMQYSIVENDYQQQQTAASSIFSPPATRGSPRKTSDNTSHFTFPTEDMPSTRGSVLFPASPLPTATLTSSSAAAILTANGNADASLPVHYEELVLKLASVYQRFNESKIPPLLPGTSHSNK